MPEAILGVRPNLEIRITGETMDILRELAFWDSLPSLCPLCLRDHNTETQLVFTFRTPTAKSGNREGETFTYYGMECLGEPSHEVQFSPRKEAKGGGLFIRMPNRKDGKPNWRLSYKASHEDDEEDQSPPERNAPRNASSSKAVAQPTAGSKIGQDGFLNENQYKELVRVGGTAGMDPAGLNQHCIDINGCPLNQLPAKEVVGYRQTLMSM